MDSFVKKMIKLVTYGMAASVLAFIGILAFRGTPQYSHSIPLIDKAHADAPIISGDGDVPGGGGGGDDDDDDDDDS